MKLEGKKKWIWEVGGGRCKWLVMQAWEARDWNSSRNSEGMGKQEGECFLQNEKLQYFVGCYWSRKETMIAKFRNTFISFLPSAIINSVRHLESFSDAISTPSPVRPHRICAFNPIIHNLSPLAVHSFYNQVQQKISMSPVLS